MKKVELLGLSVVAAALIMTTGCSSDSNSKSSGPSAPSDIAGAMEMNATSARNAIYAIRDGDASPAARRAARQAFASKLAPTRVASGSDSGSYTYDCEVSGSYSYSYVSSYTGDRWADDHSSWSDDYSSNFTYNNCVDNYSSTIDNGEETNLRTNNGTGSWTSHSEYNADTNMSKDSYSSADNYTRTYEHNETSASRTYTYATTYSGGSEHQGDNWSYTADATWSDYWAANGEYSRVDVNSTGSTIYGYKYVYGNQTGSEEGVQDYSSGKYTENGFYASYDINASGEWELDYANTYVHFTTEYSEAGNESNFKVSGGYGDECLGGTVTFNTTTDVQENQTDYFDGDDLTGGNVLPHNGAITMSGTSTASVAFSSNDTNHTSALLNVGGADENLTRWSDLSIQNCVN